MIPPKNPVNRFATRECFAHHPQALFHRTKRPVPFFCFALSPSDDLFISPHHILWYKITLHWALFLPSAARLVHKETIIIQTTK